MPTPSHEGSAHPLEIMVCKRMDLVTYKKFFLSVRFITLGVNFIYNTDGLLCCSVRGRVDPDDDETKTTCSICRRLTCFAVAVAERLYHCLAMDHFFHRYLVTVEFVVFHRRVCRHVSRVDCFVVS